MYIMDIKTLKIIFKSSLWLLGIIILVNSLAVASEDNFTYKAKNRRDPFIQPSSRAIAKSGKINIVNLKLVGMLRNPQKVMALFTAKTGPKFGYLFQDNRLFKENHQPIVGISGEINNPKEVVLRQGEKEVVFKLAID